MAYSEMLRTITLPAGSSLTGAQYKFGTISASGNVNVCASGAAPDGVIYNKPEAGQACTFAIGGVAKVVAGGVITAGQVVSSDSGGAAQAAASGGTARAGGKALLGATAAGAIIPVLLDAKPSVVTG